MARRHAITKTELLDILDAAERRAVVEIVGDTTVPARIRNLVADIFEPVFQALRRAGRRNGPLPPMGGV